MKVRDRMKKWPMIAVAALALAAAGGVALFNASRDGEAPLSGRLRPQDARLVAEGEAIYRQYCAECHGARLEGQSDWQTRGANGRLPAPPHDESGHTWHHDDELLVDLTRRGTAAVVGGGYESDMPAFEDILSEEEIIAVLSFIKSRWPKEVQARHDEINRAAR